MTGKMKSALPLALGSMLLALLASSCGAPRFSLLPDPGRELREQTVEGSGAGKVLVVHVRGTIDDKPRRGFLREAPSVVEEVAARLRRAEKDRNVKAVVLAVNSPGGTVTASDMLYHEIKGYRERSGSPVVTIIMQTGASGAYYAALPSDSILAHPTSVTGSVGVIFLRPKVVGLAGKIGVDMEVSTSGRLKDLGSPFREETDEERRIFEEMIGSLGDRFLDRLAEHRNIESAALAEIATARVFLGEDAVRLGLIDGTGYLDDALDAARRLGGLPEDGRVVIYSRRRSPGERTLYHPSASAPARAAVDIGIPPALSRPEAGYYYLWLPAFNGE